MSDCEKSKCECSEEVSVTTIDVEATAKANESLPDLCEWPEGKHIENLLIMFCDIGQLAPNRVPAYLDRFRDSYKSVLKQLANQGIAFIAIPIRPDSQTRVETVPVYGASENSVYNLPSFCESNEDAEGEYPDVSQGNFDIVNVNELEQVRCCRDANPATSNASPLYKFGQLPNGIQVEIDDE